MSAAEGSGAVSPTTHYTGETWVRNGLPHRELATWQGRALHRALALPLFASRTLGGPTLEGLLARHRIIDSILDELIEGGVSEEPGRISVIRPTKVSQRPIASSVGASQVRGNPRRAGGLSPGR